MPSISPVSPSTFPASLRRWAIARPDDLAVAVMADGETETGCLTAGELDARACRLAAELRRKGLAGEPVLLIARSDLVFVTALCGCLYAGAIAVPVPPPASGSRGQRLRAIARAAGASAAIGTVPEALRAAVAGEWIEPPAGHGTPPIDGFPNPDAVALLQYTSGSTAAPKGVVLTQGNLAANVAMLRSAFGVEPSSRLFSWLPLFHDMGLIMLMLSLASQMPFAMMPPLKFLQDPSRWLRAIDRFGATISGAPNFAFDTCRRRIEPAEIDGLDLSRWATAFCGAEPVRRATLDGFAEAFATAGFERSALFPCYGLAEATAFVAGGPLRDAPRDATADPVPDCGIPAAGTRLRIVDPETLRPCREGRVGEIWMSGAQVGQGYWRDPCSSETFAATLVEEPETFYLRTGDLGILRNGRLTIAGRLKDLIIHHGRNIDPADVEASIAGAHPSLEGLGAVFAIERGDIEQVVAVHELARGIRAMEVANLTEAAFAAVAAEHGIQLYDLRFVRHGSLPRTTSGKIMRRAASALYEQGQFARVGEYALPILGHYRPKSQFC